jgi:transposase-like protein
MNCPKCKKEAHVKAGIVKGRQRYRCKSYGYYYSVEKKSDVKSKAIRRMTLEMYPEGLGFRAIGRLLRISCGTVYQWVKKWGEKVELPVREDPVSIVELDEIHSYVMRKKLLLDMDCC